LILLVDLAEKTGRLRIFEQRVLKRLSKVAKILKEAAEGLLQSDNIVGELTKENVTLQQLCEIAVSKLELSEFGRDIGKVVVWHGTFTASLTPSH
jgi:hypothetical protein